MVSDVVLEVIPPFTLLALHLLIGIPVLAVALAVAGWPHLSRCEVAHLLGVGLVGFGVSVGAQSLRPIPPPPREQKGGLARPLRVTQS